MISLSTRYLGLSLNSPLVVAASSISSKLDGVKMAEQAGAGALVIRSLFEEQLLMERYRLEEQLAVGAESYPEALSYFPDLQHADAKEHLTRIEQMRKAVKMPLIGSLNAANPGSWTKYATQLESAGVDAIELNIYAVAADPMRGGAEIEADLFEIFERVRNAVSVPVSVKLSPFYTSVANVASTLDRCGADGLVLFNRFLQPDIEPERGSVRMDMPLSSNEEMRLPLRWMALLYGRVNADLALSTGVQSGLDIAKGMLAGATVVQVAAALLRHGVPYISTMLRELESWMGEKSYASPDAFRGLLSQRNVPDPFAYERAQYVGLLLSQTGR